MSAPTTKTKKPQADRLGTLATRVEQALEGLHGMTLHIGAVLERIDKQQPAHDRLETQQETRAPINAEPHPEYLQKQLYGILEEREKRYSEQLRNLQRRLEVLERDREAIVSAEIERRMRPPAEQGNCATAEIRKDRGFADVFEGRRAGLAGRY